MTAHVERVAAELLGTGQSPYGVEFFQNHRFFAKTGKFIRSLQSRWAANDHYDRCALFNRFRLPGRAIATVHYAGLVLVNTGRLNSAAVFLLRLFFAGRIGPGSPTKQLMALSPAYGASRPWFRSRPRQMHQDCRDNTPGDRGWRLWRKGCLFADGKI